MLLCCSFASASFTSAVRGQYGCQVSLKLTKAEFDEVKQTKFKKSTTTAAGAAVEDVFIAITVCVRMCTHVRNALYVYV